MHPNGANKNIVDHAIFSKEGPNLSNPEDTRIPKVIPKIYKLKKRKNKLIPRSKREIPNKGEVIKIAGTKPIKALIRAVNINEIIISPINPYEWSLEPSGILERPLKYMWVESAWLPHCAL